MTVATIKKTGEVVIIKKMKYDGVVTFYTNTPEFFMSPTKGLILIDTCLIDKDKLNILPNHI